MGDGDFMGVSGRASRPLFTVLISSARNIGTENLYWMWKRANMSMSFSGASLRNSSFPKEEINLADFFASPH